MSVRHVNLANSDCRGLSLCYKLHVLSLPSMLVFARQVIWWGSRSPPYNLGLCSAIIIALMFSLTLKTITTNKDSYVKECYYCYNYNIFEAIYSLLYSSDNTLQWFHIRFYNLNYSATLKCSEWSIVIRTHIHTHFL